jgi:dipeptide/tripeptide permease
MSQVTEKINKGLSKGLKTVLSVALAILVLAGLYWLIFVTKVDMSKVKSLIADQSSKYSDPTQVSTILLQGVNEIISSPVAFKQAEDYAKNSNVAIEQVLVDNATAMAKQYGYIA